MANMDPLALQRLVASMGVVSQVMDTEENKAWLDYDVADSDYREAKRSYRAHADFATSLKICNSTNQRRFKKSGRLPRAMAWLGAKNIIIKSIRRHSAILARKTTYPWATILNTLIESFLRPMAWEALFSLVAGILRRLDAFMAVYAERKRSAKVCRGHLWWQRARTDSLGRAVRLTLISAELLLRRKQRAEALRKIGEAHVLSSSSGITWL